MNHREAQQVIDGLAALFDAVPPEAPAAMADELREAGYDPTTVADRLGDVAQQALGREAERGRPRLPQRNRRPPTLRRLSPPRRQEAEPRLAADPPSGLRSDTRRPEPSRLLRRVSVGALWAVGGVLVATACWISWVDGDLSDEAHLQARAVPKASSLATDSPVHRRPQ